MKKTILTASISVLLIGCNATKTTTESTSTDTSKAVVQEKAAPAKTKSAPATVKTGKPVTKVAAPKPKKTMLVGRENRSALQEAPFNSWFDSNYAAYPVKDSLTKDIKKALKGVTITTFMGTWCGDSKRETPRMFKILDQAQFKEKNSTLITVDRTKRNPAEFTEGQNIIRVPTFIFTKNGKELGRIVERPVESLEEDMLKILTGEPYKHSYEK